jgi:hypothetical protein
VVRPRTRRPHISVLSAHALRAGTERTECTEMSGKGPCRSVARLDAEAAAVLAGFRDPDQHAHEAAAVGGSLEGESAPRVMARSPLIAPVVAMIFLAGCATPPAQEACDRPRLPTVATASLWLNTQVSTERMSSALSHANWTMTSESTSHITAHLNGSAVSLTADYETSNNPDAASVIQIASNKSSTTPEDSELLLAPSVAPLSQRLREMDLEVEVSYGGGYGCFAEV